MLDFGDDAGRLDGRIVKRTSPHSRVAAIRDVEQGKQLRPWRRVRRRSLGTGFLGELVQVLLHQGGLTQKVLVSVRLDTAALLAILATALAKLRSP